MWEFGSAWLKVHVVLVGVAVAGPGIGSAWEFAACAGCCHDAWLAMALEEPVTSLLLAIRLLALMEYRALVFPIVLAAPVAPVVPRSVDLQA